MQNFSKKEWFEIIETSLRKGSMDDLRWKITDEFEGPAFAHEDDMLYAAEPVGLNADWKIGRMISERDMEISAEEIYFDHAIVEAGYESPVEKLPESVSSCYWLNSTPTFINARIASNKLFSREVFLFDDLAPLNAGELYSICTQHGKISFGISIKETDIIDPFTGLISAFSMLFDFLKQAENNAVRSLLLRDFVFEIGHSSSFLFDIAKMKALRILFYNLQSSFDLQVQDCTLLSHIEVGSLAANENDQLIFSSIAGMAAIIGGCSTLYFDLTKAASSDTNNLIRLTENIQLIMKEEAFMDRVKDPAAGSYTIETLSNSIASACWEQLK